MTRSRGEVYKPVPFNPKSEEGDPVLPTLSAMRDHLQFLLNSTRAEGVVYGTNFVTGGDMGSGKTVAIETAPKPILIDSFDPDGTSSISRRFLESGAIMVNRTFEEEYIPQPTAYRRWFNTFNHLRKNGVFEYLGTYVMDSATMFAEAALNYVMKGVGRPAQVPQLQDYLAQLLLLQAMFKYVCSTPCNVIVNFHLEDAKNEDGNVIGKEFLITGKGAIRIPLLFSEVYSLVTVRNPDGNLARNFITQPHGLYKARTRMGREGNFGIFEKANYGELLRKGGKQYMDKPLLSTLVEDKLVEAVASGAQA